MSARDFKGRGGGFGGFDTYHKEKLDGLGFVQCVGLVLRRGFQAPSHLGETIQDAGSIDIQHIKHMEFDFSTDDDDPSYLNADSFSEKMINILCLYWFVSCLFTILNGVLSVVQQLVTQGVGAGLMSLIGQAISCAVSVALWTILVAAVTWVYSHFYHRWLAIMGIVFLLFNVAMLVINGIGLATGLGSLIGALSLKFGLFYLLKMILDFILKVFNVFMTYYQIANVSHILE